MTPITSLDLTGYTEREPGTWTDGRGLVLSVHFFDLVPDLPAPLRRPDQLFHGLARSTASAGGGLIEAELGKVDTVPAVRQLVKVPRPGGHGQVFLGSWTVPRASCSTVVKVQAAEGGMTGMREAIILGRTGPDRYFTPHPYGPDIEGGLPHHIGDDQEWDAEFPDHPLTRVRAALHRIIPTVVLREDFKSLHPFEGTAPALHRPVTPTSPRPGIRHWFRRG
ncbi:hypothetical protein OG592_37835 [Streptomyces avidinii]|uniref:hypothetical protein n=1 Tax=Streptomyces avidinii TaxID=1895 RepID=UPI0038683009|nr:hypothetical protein OG592_37835 [Streptomyces avidinii]